MRLRARASAVAAAAQLAKATAGVVVAKPPMGVTPLKAMRQALSALQGLPPIGESHPRKDVQVEALRQGNFAVDAARELVAAVVACVGRHQPRNANAATLVGAAAAACTV